MRQPPHRVADHLHLGHQLRHPAADPLHQRVQPGVLPFGLGPYGAQRGGRGHDRRDVDVAGHPPALALVGRQRGGVPDALAQGEDADAGRAAPLVRARGQQRPARRDVHPSGALGGVHQQRHPGPGAERGDLTDRLDGPHLVVGALQCGQCGVGAQQGAEGRRVDPAGAVDGGDRDLAAARLVAFGDVQHAGVLHRGVHQVRAAPPVTGEGAQQAELDGLCPAGGEGDLVGPRAQDGGDRLAGGVQQHPGLPAGAVQPGRIGPALVQGGGQGLPRDGVQGGRRSHVEIHGHI